MSLFEDIKSLIHKTIENGDLISTENLLAAFTKTGLEPDCDILYCYALYCYYTKQYAVCIYWIKLAVKKYGCCDTINELIDELEIDISDVDDIVDVTVFRRPLNILMYTGLIDIIDYTVEEFKKCYERLGHTVYTLDISENNEKVLEEFIDIVNKGIDFVQVFNNNIFKVKVESTGKDYLEMKQIPCFDYMFDHPMYFQSFNNELPKNIVISCVDKNHNKYLDRFYNGRISNFFLPLGSAAGEETDIPWTERRNTALYVGSLKKNDKMIEDELSRKITEYLIEHTRSTSEEAIEICYKAFVNPKANDDEINNAIDKYHYVDMNVNYHFRKKLVEVLVKNGIDVEVYGYGWQEVEFFDNPHFHYGGWISQNQCLNLMKNSKFVLNSMPWFKDGIHDRVYNAMLAKSICITDTSKYMEEFFADKRDLVLYDLDDMEIIPEIITYYEEHPEEATKIANRGYSSVIKNHTWENRAIELLLYYFSKQER